MEWINPPEHWLMGGDTITAEASPGTDIWRQPGEGGIRDNAHFYHHPVEGDFTAVVTVDGSFNGLFDQAGMLARLDERTWLKCGIEFVEGKRYASAVMTREWSDWSLTPLPDSGPVFFRLERHGPLLKVFCAAEPGGEPVMIRKGYFTETAGFSCGLMLAAPRGGGFEAVFRGYHVEKTAP